MKLNKFKTFVPAAALLLSASLSSCMADLDKGNIDPNVDATPNITGLYSKCYAGLIITSIIILLRISFDSPLYIN